MQHAVIGGNEESLLAVRVGGPECRVIGCYRVGKCLVGGANKYRF